MEYKILKYFSLLLSILKRLKMVAWLCHRNLKVCHISIKHPATPDNSLNPRLDYFNNFEFRVEFVV